jgi:hypothetical protein
LARSDSAELEVERGSAVRGLGDGSGGRRKKLAELVLGYLQSDFTEFEKACDECPAAIRDDDGYCGVCKLRALEERFPLDFRAWISNLTRLSQWGKAGYPLGEEGLNYEDWQALATIRRFYEVKDLEALASRFQPSAE